MSKTKEELNKIKEEVDAVNEKLSELTPEEIAQVSGGGVRPVRTSQHVIKPVVVETAAVLKPWIHPSK